MRTTRRQSGFTLIEIMIVMAIIAVLSAGVMIVIPIAKKQAAIARTQTLLSEVEALLSSVRTQLDEYPPTQWSQLQIGSKRVGKEFGTSNGLNDGIETVALVIFMAQIDIGERLDVSHLANLDEDVLPNKFTIHGKNDLFEIVDAWGNPLVYIHHRDYASTGFNYKPTMEAENENGPWLAVAQKSEKTESYFNPHSFQLISAGPDGILHTKDDITNFGE